MGSSKAGKLKEQKHIGKLLQTIGQKGSDFFGNEMVQRGFEWVGKGLGAGVIPIVGTHIGGEIGEGLANTLSYGSGLIGEVGGMMSGEKNIKDVLTYVPNRVVNDIKSATIDSPIAKVIRGEMNWRDAVINNLEENAMINILAPNKTHAWKDNQGNYHKEYVPGSKMVVGEWKSSPTVPRPDPSSNNIRIGPNGEVIRNGF